MDPEDDLDGSDLSNQGPEGDGGYEAHVARQNAAYVLAFEQMEAALSPEVIRHSFPFSAVNFPERLAPAQSASPLSVRGSR